MRRRQIPTPGLVFDDNILTFDDVIDGRCALELAHTPPQARADHGCEHDARNDGNGEKEKPQHQNYCAAGRHQQARHPVLSDWRVMHLHWTLHSEVKGWTTRPSCRSVSCIVRTLHRISK